MSLIQIINKRGERIDPCGAPKDDLAISDFVKFSLNYVRRFDITFFNRLYGIPLIP